MEEEERPHDDMGDNNNNANTNNKCVNKATAAAADEAKAAWQLQLQLDFHLLVRGHWLLSWDCSGRGGCTQTACLSVPPYGNFLKVNQTRHALQQPGTQWEELEGGKVTLAVNRKALTFGYVLPLISSHNQCSHNNGNGEVTHAHNASRDNERTISISAFPFYNDDCKSKAGRLDGTERSRGGDNLLADGSAIAAITLSDVRNLYKICDICTYVCVLYIDR